MTRFVPVTVLVVLLAAGGVAGAQTAGGTLPNGAVINFTRLQIPDSNLNFNDATANTPQFFQYFNLAHCNCAQAAVGTPNVIGTFNYLVHETPASGLHVGVTFVAGTDCSDPAHQSGGSSPSCSPTVPPLDSVNDLDTELNVNGSNFRNFNLYQVVNANQTSAACVQLDNVNSSIWALVSTGAMGALFDYTNSVVAGTLGNAVAAGTTSGIDTKPPPLPASLTAKPGDGQILISWQPPAANATDVYYYQALCQAVDGSPISTGATPQYTTTEATCPGKATMDQIAAETPTATPLDNGEEMATPSAALLALDSKFICGPTGNATSTSLTIGNLQDGTAYQIALVVIDQHGNFTATYFDHTITPVPSTDFWEDLHGRGSKAEGGLCLLAETYGDNSALTQALRGFRDDNLGGSRVGRWLTDAYYATLGKLGTYVHGSTALQIVSAIVLAPVVALALLWHWLTLPGLLAVIAAAWLWRRRRAARRIVARLDRRLLAGRIARSTAIALVGAVILFGPRAAHAGGGGYQAYWDADNGIDDNQPTGDEPQDISWHVGFRVGPYVPDIDNQLGVHPGPYEQMFPGTYIMPMLDVDRILWSGFGGQVGVGISLGYLVRKERTFVETSLASDMTRARASDLNRFRLFPTALTATYRFTMLDDDYGIPIVPYVRAGLAYDIWWISVGDGDGAKYARVCSDGKPLDVEANCSVNKALGASAGVTGSIGLAVRAERIDAAAAMSMRASGVQHAGIYAELSLAKVDGFGSDTKLSVGDTTWFAGVDFEF